MYILICSVEREIYAPQFFQTKDAARLAMCKHMGKILDEPTQALYESYLAGEEFNSDTCVLENCAWTKKYGYNYDWKIFNLEGLKVI